MEPSLVVVEGWLKNIKANKSNKIKFKKRNLYTANAKKRNKINKYIKIFTLSD